jgi:hypothetical protein
MISSDDLDLRLRDWMAVSATTAPDGPVQRALETIAYVGQRPGFLATTGLGTAVWAPVRWSSARIVLIGLLIVALVGAAVMVASRRPDEARPRPSGPLPSAALVSAPLKLTSPDTLTFGMLDPFGPKVNGGRVSMIDPTLVRLSDGRALILGGSSDRTGSLQSVDSVGIYDPERRGITATGPMNVAREGATAVTLADGRVLVLGGHQVLGDTGRTVTEAEIFDPATGRFTLVDPMLTGRDPCHCGVTFQVLVQMHATLMGDGRVFIAGGSQAGVAGTSFADIFDPASGSFERVEIGCDASRGAQTALADGRILVLCSDSLFTGDSTRARIFDPATDGFTSPAQPAGGSAGVATLLPDGRILVTGAVLAAAKASAELFDPATDSWSQVDSSINPSADVAVTLSDGRVDFADQDPRNAVIFDPQANAFVAGPRIEKLGLLTSVALSDDRILVQEGGNLILYAFEPAQ